MKYISITVVLVLLLLPDNTDSASFFGSYSQQVQRNFPIIFVPGKGGNQLEAKVSKPSSEGSHCPKVSDWHRTWLDVWSFLTGIHVRLIQRKQCMTMHFPSLVQKYVDSVVLGVGRPRASYLGVSS